MNRLGLCLLLLLTVSGCDVFDDNDSTAPLVAINQNPVAAAGADQTAAETTVVTLNGSASTDADGMVASYMWTQTAGPAAALTNANMAIATFTAPNVMANTVLTFQLTVTDNSGATATDTVNITVTDTPANQPPTANAGADQMAVEATMVTLNGSASADADGTVVSYMWTQTAGPNAALTNANMVMATFTAPNVMANTVLTFQLTVTDNSGATATDTVNVTVTDTPPMNQAPTANAGPDQTVAQAAMVTLNGAASADMDGMITAFAWTQTTGPMVALTNANMAMATFTAPAVAANTAFTFSLQVTDNGGAMATDTVVITVTATAQVQISGKITYDHVPPVQAAMSGALDYTMITQDPVRGATVQALDAANMVLATTRTDNAGDYVLTVASNTNVRIRVRAEAIQAGPPSWDVRIVDNTSAGAAYVLDGPLADSGAANTTRNLNAPSGWDNAMMAYTATRSAGPFAILESIYEAMTKTAAADATVVFPAVNVNWSINNTTAAPTAMCGLAQGCISTSFYNGTAIYIVGSANNDTDEYDGHIIVHEWGHYFEAQLSRSDSIGGTHSGGDVLDMRVAFGEGFGNALSGIITGDPSYRDSTGMSQGGGFEDNVETNTLAGWFNESTVQSLLYDIFDATADGATDTVALGWGPMYQTFASPQYRQNAARTSIFAYLTRLKADNAGSAAAITALAATFNVNGTDEFAAGETSLPAAAMGNAANILPVYTDILPNAMPVRVCSTNQFGIIGGGNRLSNRRFMRLNITTAANYAFTAVAASGMNPDPDMHVYMNQTNLMRGNVTGDETGLPPIALQPGIHILEVFDFCNSNPMPMGTCPAGGNASTCIDVTVTQM